MLTCPKFSWRLCRYKALILQGEIWCWSLLGLRLSTPVRRSFFLPFCVTYVKTNLSVDLNRSFIERNFARLHNVVRKLSPAQLYVSIRHSHAWNTYEIAASLQVQIYPLGISFCYFVRKVGGGRGARQATPSANTNHNWLTKLNDKSG